MRRMVVDLGCEANIGLGSDEREDLKDLRSQECGDNSDSAGTMMQKSRKRRNKIEQSCAETWTEIQLSGCTA